MTTINTRTPIASSNPMSTEIISALTTLRTYLVPKEPSASPLSRRVGVRVPPLALLIAAELAEGQRFTEYPSAEARDVADRVRDVMPVVEAIEQITEQARALLRERQGNLETKTFGLYGAMKQLARFTPDPTLRRLVKDMGIVLRVQRGKKRPQEVAPVVAPVEPVTPIG